MLLYDFNALTCDFKDRLSKGTYSSPSTETATKQPGWSVLCKGIMKSLRIPLGGVWTYKFQPKSLTNIPRAETIIYTRRLIKLREYFNKPWMTKNNEWTHAHNRMWMWKVKEAT